jgi:hypothetical protein
MEEIASRYGGGSVSGIASDLAEPYATLAAIVDYTESAGYQDGTLSDFDTSDMQLDLALEKEPAVSGSIKLGCSWWTRLCCSITRSPTLWPEQPLDTRCLTSSGRSLTNQGGLQRCRLRRSDGGYKRRASAPAGDRQ